MKVIVNKAYDTLVGPERVIARVVVVSAGANPGAFIVQDERGSRFPRWESELKDVASAQ